MLRDLKHGDKDRAEQLAEQVVKGDANALDAQLWQVQVLRALGKPEKAEAALLALTAQRPTETGPWLQLLMLQVSQNRMKEAVETVEQIRKNVRVERPELLWAQCYRIAAKFPEAEQFYREALRKWPNEPHGAGRGGRLLRADRQTGRGREYAAQGHRERPRAHLGDPPAGRCSLAGHRGDRAALAEALRLIGPEARPDDTPDDRLMRAKVYMEGPEPRHREQALAILQQLVDELPQAPAIHELMARINLVAMGDRAEARAHAAIAAGSRHGRGDLALHEYSAHR